MKFLVDAQLPRRLVKQLQQAGHEAIHTLDLPLGNKTPDTFINDLSISDHYIVVTKDSDFVDSFHLHKSLGSYYWWQQAISGILSWKHYSSRILIRLLMDLWLPILLR